MTRQLLSTLPAELRNLIYAYASIPTTDSATTTGLPFTTKVYEASHTKVTICPVHHGNLGLLSLRKYNFFEGEEYHSWLLSQGLEIRIAVEFKGHVNTFLQEHWDKRMAIHMKKLVKKYPWIATAADWDIRIIWYPKFDPRGTTSGAPAKIVNAMVGTLLGYQDRVVRERRGDVRVQWNVPYHIASVKRNLGRRFGLEKFLTAATDPVNREIREVVLGPHPVTFGSSAGEKVSPGLITLSRTCSAPQMLVVDNGRVEWSKVAQGKLVARQVINRERAWREKTYNVGWHWTDEMLLWDLEVECPSLHAVLVDK